MIYNKPRDFIFKAPAPEKEKKQKKQKVKKEKPDFDRSGTYQF